MKNKNTNLKILYVLSSLTLGGTETHLLRLSSGLKEKGYLVSICCLYNQLEIADRFKKQGIDVLCLDVKSIWDIRGFLRLWRILKKGGYDIVHAYLFDSSIYSAIVAKIAGVKAIITSRRNYDDWMRIPHIILQKIANCFTDKILVNAKSLEDLVVKQEGFSRDDILPIYNSINKAQYDIKLTDQNITNMRKSIGVNPDEYMILCTAKFKISKGHAFLLQAAKTVIEKMPKAKFILMGKGPEETRVKSKARDLGIQEKVIFIGQRDDVAQILKIADLCILSSIREGFANTILEYMASGKAIVATDVGGNREIITSGENGILVSKGDVSRFSNEIMSLLKNRDMRTKLGNRAKERVSDITFQPEYETERFNAVYRELLNINIAKGGLVGQLKNKLLPVKTFLRDNWFGSKEGRKSVTHNPSLEPRDIKEIQVKKEKKKRPNVIIMSIDPLRRDHVGAYGYKRNTTPNIDSFAKRSDVFTNAYSQAPWTTPSHMSLFTSLYPSFHGVDQPMSDTMRRLGEDKKTLAEYLQKAGYLTAAFTGSGSISGRWGFSRGFTVYNETPSEEVVPKGHDISVIYTKVVDWIKENKNKDFFLFFHTYNTHTPYNDRYFVDKEQINKNSKYEHMKALYDGDIRITDAYFGNFIATLKNEGLLEDTVIVLISDHGEDFGEHYPFEMTKGHGHSLYEELLQIPFIIYNPLLREKGRIIDKNVRLIDVMPTLLDILNIPIAQDVQGKSLLPLLKGESIEMPKYFYAEAICHGPERKMVFDGRYKYIYSPEPNIQKTNRKIYPVQMHELYDIQKDPGERKNLYYMEKEMAKLMHEKLTEFMHSAESKKRFGEEDEFKVDDKLKKRLQSLGYIE